MNNAQIIMWALLLFCISFINLIICIMKVVLHNIQNVYMQDPIYDEIKSTKRKSSIKSFVIFLVTFAIGMALMSALH